MLRSMQSWSAQQPRRRSSPSLPSLALLLAALSLYEWLLLAPHVQAEGSGSGTDIQSQHTTAATAVGSADDPWVIPDGYDHWCTEPSYLCENGGDRADKAADVNLLKPSTWRLRLPWWGSKPGPGTETSPASTGFTANLSPDESSHSSTAPPPAAAATGVSGPLGRRGSPEAAAATAAATETGVRGGGGRTDPWVVVDAVMAEVSPHDTVMYVEKRGTFVRRHGKTPAAAAAASARKAGGSSGGGGNSGARRSLAQQAPEQDSSVDRANVAFNPRLACEGCPPYDARVRVTDPARPPFAAVGLLMQERRKLLSGSVSQCTGTLVGPRHVVTAAHCVVAPDRWSFIQQVEFYPRLNAGDPAARVESVPVQTIRVLERYLRLGSASVAALNFDFALLTLAAAAPPGSTALPLAPGEGREVLDLQTAGYPGDKPRGTMWTVRCPAVRFNFDGTALEGCGSRCSNMVVHDCVSWEGQSGSAIWQVSPQPPTPPPSSPPSGNGSASSPSLPAPASPAAATFAAPSGGGSSGSGNGSSSSSSRSGNHTIRAILTGVIKLSDGTSYNVGTEMNKFVYGTLATWFNEDVEAQQGGAGAGVAAKMEVPPGMPPADDALKFRRVGAEEDADADARSGAAGSSSRQGPQAATPGSMQQAAPGEGWRRPQVQQPQPQLQPQPQPESPPLGRPSSAGRNGLDEKRMRRVITGRRRHRDSR